MVQILGRGTLEDETVDKFLHFCKFIQQTLLQPLDILEAEDFERDITMKLKRIVSGDGQGKRTDRLQTIATRLILFVQSKDYAFKEEHAQNLISFLISDDMDSSIRFNTYTRIVNIKKGHARKLYRAISKAKNKKLATLIKDSF